MTTTQQQIEAQLPEGWTATYKAPKDVHASARYTILDQRGSYIGTAKNAWDAGSLIKGHLAPAAPETTTASPATAAPRPGWYRRAQAAGHGTCGSCGERLVIALDGTGYPECPGCGTRQR